MRAREPSKTPDLERNRGGSVAQKTLPRSLSPLRAHGWKPVLHCAGGIEGGTALLMRGGARHGR